MSYACRCPCGTTRFEITGEPIIRFHCHCTICQRQYDSPSVDVALFRLDDVQLPADHGIVFVRLKRFGAVDRGRCPRCEKPILATMGEGAKGFGFVAARNFAHPERLPAPEMHVFYNTRVAAVDDDLPKFNNALTSRFAFIRRMLGSGNRTPA